MNLCKPDPPELGGGGGSMPQRVVMAVKLHVWSSPSSPLYHPHYVLSPHHHHHRKPAAAAAAAWLRQGGGITLLHSSALTHSCTAVFGAAPPPPQVFGAAGHTAQCVWLKDFFSFFFGTPARAFLLFFPPLLALITKPHCFIYAWRDWKWMKCFHSIRERKTIQG